MAVEAAALDLKQLSRILPATKGLLEDSDVTELMVTCHPARGVIVFFEKAGHVFRAQLPDVTVRQVTSACHLIARPLGSDPKRQPLIDGRLGDGSRVAIAVPPASPLGPAVTIRRFSKVKFSGGDLVSRGALPQHVLDILVGSLKRGGNVLVAGGTGSGKTTLLNALIGEFDKDARFVVIEDTVELKIDHVNTLRLEARGLGASGLTPRDMVKHALRQRPDHIVLGEVRGAEAYDVVQALNTGHGGSMTTIHANTAEDALLRMASCALQGSEGMPWDVVATSVSMAFNLVVYQCRRPDRTRGVSEVLEVKDYNRATGRWSFDPKWIYNPDEGRDAERPPVFDSTPLRDAQPVEAALDAGGADGDPPIRPVLVPPLDDAAHERAMESSVEVPPAAAADGVRG